jgi:nucleotide-binding universal stress UspA family protein
MFRKIFVPLDGSGTAEKVLPFARLLARGLQLPIELLAVVDPAEMALHMSGAQAAMARDLLDQSARQFDRYLQNVVKNFPARLVKYSVRSGDVAEVIIESAAPEPQALIAMATHGRSGVGRWLLGSVTEKVLRGASNAVLVVRAPDENSPVWEMRSLKRLIVPLDGSELSERILPYAEILAKQLELEVLLLCAYGGPLSSQGGDEGFFGTRQANAFLAELHAETLQYLALKSENLRRQGVRHTGVAAKEGLAADAIIAAASETPDTLVAMCTHGRSGMKRWVMGSVTETVVRHSRSPVLIVRSADSSPV